MSDKFDPAKEQLHFAKEAVRYRELYYQGQNEAIAVHGELMGPIVWSETKKAQQFAANNKWHMQQADMFGAVATTAYMRMLVTEARVHSKLLQNILDKLKEQ